MNESKARLEIIQVNSTMYPSSESEESIDEAITDDSYKRCSEVASNVIAKFDPYTVGLKEIVIHARTDLRRGLASKDTIWIRCLTDVEEFENVLIHELGHIVDENYLIQDGNDVSAGFHDISKSDLSFEGYVSEYASTNEHEDFAETFLFYIKYGSEFRHLAQSNNLLLSKYDFMRDYVFDGYEFEIDEAYSERLISLFPENGSRPYDSTVLFKK